jgi:WhiB family transcriptional regulator, redox-sensing transcriptional regulator
VSALAFRERAACAGMDTEVFYPPLGTMRPSPLAMIACWDRCEVRVECLRYALDYPYLTEGGVWGGLIEADRVRLAARLRYQAKRRPRVLEPCGTSAAYKRHINHKEKPCQPCWEAEQARQAGYRQARKQQREDTAA